MAKKNGKIIGSKIYNKQTGELIRIKRVKNEYNVECITEDHKVVRKAVEDINQNYCGISGVGYLYVFHVQNRKGSDDDILISFLRQCDIDKDDLQPFIIGRQAITDIYANTVGYNIMGCITSILSAPANTDMSSFEQYESVISESIMKMYIDDTLEDILEYIPKYRYDKVFEKMRNIKYNDQFNFSKSLKDFLVENSFMYEFCSAFNIYTLDIDDDIFEPVDEDFVICNNIGLVTKILEDRLGCQINILGFMRFNKYIDLKTIENTGFVKVKCNPNSKDIIIVKIIRGDKISTNYSGFISNKKIQSKLIILLL